MYTRHLNVYKGIDNVLEFKLLNADQKPIDILGIYTPKFVAFDENKHLVIEHEGVILQEPSDSTTITKKGMFKVTVTENDLLNLKEQYLSYAIYLVDTNNSRVLTYTDSWFGAQGTLKINSDAFPGPSESLVVDTFIEDQQRVGINDSVWYSEIADAQPGVNGNEALHTAVIYANNYVGDVVVQVSLDNSTISEFIDWADVVTVSFDGTETEPKPVNFNGVFNFIRFKLTADPDGKVSKILVRN